MSAYLRVTPTPHHRAAPRLAEGGYRTTDRVHARRWTLLLLALVITPLALCVGVGRLGPDSMTAELAVAGGLVALSLMVAAMVLPSRIKFLTAQLGIETVLRAHRAVAILAVLFVAVHVVLVVAANPKGLRILDLRSAPPRVWAASAATVAIGALVVLAITRRRRNPRYEGWRIVHVVLATVAMVGTALHVLWLHILVDRTLTRWWFAGLTALMVLLAVYRWAWRPLRMLRRPYVVEEVRPESSSSVTLVLRARGHVGVKFRPGQFAWLKFGGSPFTFEEHPFTIASAATEPARKEFTIKALGDFTELLSGLRPGRRVYLDGPHGRFTTDGLRSAGFVLVAGGVGITPMLSILRTLAERRDRRPHLLLVGARSVEDFLHRAELADLQRRLDLVVIEVVGDPPEGWWGEEGYIDKYLLDNYLPRGRLRTRTDYFLCGPPPMLSAVLDALYDLEVPAHRVHTEMFDMV
ncbi:3-phenylpropionate/trans-cinnamate dioxygenase ferredoxin reductase subunit [Actinopolymorpha cephalotaxi]|uniref:3-phenylpropionate/trans-cinnamate dioxygenase ferredoxin reductase subunit n=1 Tax=Actinopolymorpha cephalotaxi TaxID=504797 RepID=A0A1I2XRT7_9ACTN|nr:ferredoxin reductase family protein [Actinopolymorpha cephalotaxi]NYH87120.1 3-phenylpropionate/trans-cinnamate dioxygenase ferredoxin reductase subunit [Actinopolymorpha cephalotaxi]SFH15436.1 3-phenylpropionate/trans-cinnamate dioxygenase ferredoxin reductase subunit [Actinopolymorpha cephalotaxi]